MVVFICLIIYLMMNAVEQWNNQMAKKIYVLDTSVCLTDFNAITSFANNDILIPLKVLEEVDNHKQRQDGVGVNARGFIRLLDSLREKGSLIKGVRLGKGKGLLSVCDYKSSCVPESFDLSVPDNQIIATAISHIHTQSESPRPKKVILVSRDINMRVKCDAVGISAQDYINEKVVSDRTDMYTGFSTLLVDDQLIDQFYEGEDIHLPEDSGKFYPNEYIMLVSSSNEKKTAIAKYKSETEKLLKVAECNGGKKKAAWGVKPRNKEQGFALNLLRDPDVHIISLVGKAGSGKTLLALSAGLEQVLEGQGKYNHLIVSRSVQPMGKDIGFLPGTMEDKMMPWIAPIRDNLKYLMGNDKGALDSYIGQGVIEIEALTYIRGRSIPNAFIIIDEAQNLTTHELKTIITRVGEGTKIVLTGDIEQIDNVYVDEFSNGLTYAVEKFKEYDLSGHVTLLKGERSKVATLAAKIL
jgi:PhoH-like ATPase